MKSPNSFLGQIKMIFRRPTPAEIAARELAEAELSRLQHLTAVEFSTAMVGYHDARIKRLKAFLKTRGGDE
jgi:hypothetical protein